MSLVLLLRNKDFATSVVSLGATAEIQVSALDITASISEKVFSAVPAAEIQLTSLDVTASNGIQAGFIDLFSLLQGGIAVTDGSSIALVPTATIALESLDPVAEVKAKTGGGGRRRRPISDFAERFILRPPVVSKVGTETVQIFCFPVASRVSDNQIGSVPAVEVKFSEFQPRAFLSENVRGYVPRAEVALNCGGIRAIQGYHTIAEDELFLLLAA
jgi:hypothetical protein